MNAKEIFFTGLKRLRERSKYQMIIEINQQKASETEAEAAKWNYHIRKLIQNTYLLAELGLNES